MLEIAEGVTCGCAHTIKGASEHFMCQATKAAGVTWDQTMRARRVSPAVMAADPDRVRVWRAAIECGI